MSTLIVMHGESGRLDATTAELLNAAAALGESITLGVIADDPAVVDTSSVCGVDRVIGVRVPAERVDHHSLQYAVDALLKLVIPRVVLLPFNWDTAAFATALAERNDFNFASDVIDLDRDADGALLVTRLVYAGKVRARLRFSGESATLLLLRPGVWPALTTGSAAPVMEIAEAVITEPPQIRLIKRTAAIADGPDLTKAELIFAVGRGIGTAENVTVFADIARKFGGALGASRPVVDAGLLPRGHQVGQSGATVRPKLYVAFGISGAIQHLAGMSASKTIIAVNTDKDAPIFDAAHFAAHVDAMEVAKCLLAGE